MPSLDPNWMRWLSRGPVTGADLPPDMNADPAVLQQVAMSQPMDDTTPPSMPQPSPSSGGLSAGNLANWAAILGGLGLGLARPRVAPQALNNFQAANMMQWRDDQREFARQRLELAQREEATKRQILGQIIGPEGGATPPPAVAGATAAPPPAPPTTSAVPHFAAPPVSGMTTPLQFEPQARTAVPPDQPFFTGEPTPVRGNTSTSLSAYGLSKTQSTNRGTEKEQATNAAVNDLTTAWMQNPEQAQRDPRRLLKETLSRYPAADSKEVRQNLSNTLFETYHAEVLRANPSLDPKSAFRQAYNAASQDLGPGMFVPTDQMRTLATQVPSIDEQRSLATIQGDKSKQAQLNAVESAREASITGARNTADFFTKPYTPGEAQQFENPPRVGTTPAQQAGSQAPMSFERQTGLGVRERERSQREVQLEAVAPSISSVVERAEQIRKGFSELNLMSLAQRGKNWLDIAQSQLTGFPQTELGKLVTSYDDMVQTSGPFMAKAVQGNVGNLTEQEQAVGRQGFPKTFRELVNSPIAGNDRMSVLSTVLAMELRDPNFRLSRLDVPMSEFEKSVEAHRQQLIRTRPELFSRVPQLPPTGVSPPAQGMAPPTLQTPPMTPEDQAIKDRINQEMSDYLRKRQ